MSRACFIVVLLLIAKTFEVEAQFSNLNGGANDPVRAFYSASPDSLFVVGRFTQIGSNNFNHIAIWDGNDWNSFGNNDLFSSPHDVTCITKFNNEIIIGGAFDSIGNTPVNNIAKWNGSSWEQMGMGFDNFVNALYVFNGELYAGGNFTYSGNNSVKAIGKWNGVNWEPVGDFNGYIFSFTEHNNKLIVAGLFTLNAPSAANIIAFDGINWDTNYSNIDDFIIKVRNINDTLYACGTFTAIPTNPSNYLSTFYNGGWHEMPSPTGGQNTVTDIIEYNGKKYVCGYFTNPPDIGILNNNYYDSLFNANGFVSALTVFDNKLFMAGQFFQTINNANYNCVINYDDFTNNIVRLNNTELIQVMPNPAIDNKIKILNNFNSFLRIIIYNINGKVVISENVNNELILNLESGVYIMKSIYNGITYTNKLIIL